MKNFLTKTVCLLLALVLVFSLMGCDNISGSNSSSQNNSTNSGNVGDNTGGNTGDNDGDNGSNVVKPSNATTVTVNYANSSQSQNTSEATLISAIDMVYSSTVYITNIVGNSIGSGCGVIVDITVDGGEEGVCYVFTCYHVIADFEILELVIPSVPVVEGDDGAYYDYGNIDYEKYVFTTEGENPTIAYIGGDAVTDIAVLKIDYSEYENFTPVKAKISNIEERPYKIGQSIFAVGNPGGYYGSVSQGIISYVNRNVSIDDIGPIDVIQIDALVDHGNSGGGVYNLYGELVGLVNGGNNNYNGIAFAIPITTKTATNDVTEETDTGLVNIATQLITTAWSDDQGNYNYGYVKGRWKFGIVVNATRDYYAQIYSLQPGSAFIGKLEVGDKLTGISYYRGEELYSVTFDPNSSLVPYYQFQEEYSYMMPYVSIGSEITFTYLRNDVEGTVTGVLNQFIYRDTGMGLGPQAQS